VTYDIAWECSALGETEIDAALKAKYEAELAAAAAQPLPEDDDDDL